MSAFPSIEIIAQVDAAEQGGVKTGVEFLGGCLKAVRNGVQQPIKLAFADPAAEASKIPPARIFITSMQVELARPKRTREDIFEHWAGHLKELQKHSALVFLCTIFRNVSNQGASGDSIDVLARIRELNLIAVKLSHALGIKVIDIDRTMAHFGDRVLLSDFRMRSPRATDAFAHTVASAILAAGPDDLIDPMDQEKARKALGDIDSLPRLIRRREDARRQRAEANG
ncbi:MAG: hypothetical protein KUG65_09570 [Sphingomonadaceae bacterium]|nr:hypothetical protein [Sphingomonadaceae bacterium]